MSEQTNSTKRALRILKALKGRTFIGLSNKELADALNESPVNITQALKVLIDEGMVEKSEETGRFSLSILTLQIAETHRREHEKMQNKLKELGHRVDTGSSFGNLL